MYNYQDYLQNKPKKELLQFSLSDFFLMNPEAIAEVLGSKASVSRDKYKTLQCLESAAVNSLISMDWNGTLLHVLPMMQINFKVSSENGLCR